MVIVAAIVVVEVTEELAIVTDLVLFSIKLSLKKSL